MLNMRMLVAGPGTFCLPNSETHRRRTPIVMLSGSDCETEAWTAGVNAFLREPEDVGQIASDYRSAAQHRGLAELSTRDSVVSPSGTRAQTSYYRTLCQPKKHQSPNLI